MRAGTAKGGRDYPRNAPMLYNRRHGGKREKEKRRGNTREKRPRSGEGAGAS